MSNNKIVIVRRGREENTFQSEDGENGEIENEHLKVKNSISPSIMGTS